MPPRNFVPELLLKIGTSKAFRNLRNREHLSGITSGIFNLLKLAEDKYLLHSSYGKSQLMPAILGTVLSLDLSSQRDLCSIRKNKT